MIKEKFKNGLIGKITLVASGTLFAQIINFVVTPIITRLYTTENYGILSIYTSTITIAVIIATLMYQKSLPIIFAESDAKRMVHICLKILCISTLVIFALCFFLNTETFSFLGIRELYSFRFAIPVAVFIVGCYEILLQWVYRKRDYKLIPKTRVIQALSSGGIKVLGGLINAAPIWLIVGTMASQGAGVLTFFRRYKKDVEQTNIDDGEFKSDGALIKRYYRFPVFSLPADFVNTFCNQLPVLIIAGIYDATHSGYYGLANSIINIPVSLVVTSIARVLYAETAKMGKDKPRALYSLCKKMVRIVALVMIVPCIVLISFGPTLFSLFFGKNWYEAGVYARLMTGMIFSYSLVIPVGRILEIFEKQSYEFVINCGRLAFLGLSFLLIKLLNIDSYSAVFTFSSVNMIAYFALLIAVFYCIKKRFDFTDQ